MASALTEHQIDSFRRDGFVTGLQAMSADQANSIRGELEAFEASSGTPMSSAFRQKSHLLFPWAADLVRCEVIVDAVAELLGPNLLCWGTTFFIKEANTTSFVSWHQDSTYWGLSAPDVVTAWLAISASTIANGAMQVVPGTHHMDQLPHHDTFHADNLLSRGQEVSVDIGDQQPVPLELEPGQFSLHHVRLVHGSMPNHSTDRRIGFAMRFIPTSIYQRDANRDSAVLVRGVDDFGHFEHEPLATSLLAPDLVELHARIHERTTKHLLRGMPGN